MRVPVGWFVFIIWDETSEAVKKSNLVLINLLTLRLYYRITDFSLLFALTTITVSLITTVVVGIVVSFM